MVEENQMNDKGIDNGKDRFYLLQGCELPQQETVQTVC